MVELNVNNNNDPMMIPNNDNDPMMIPLDYKADVTGISNAFRAACVSKYQPLLFDFAFHCLFPYQS